MSYAKIRIKAGKPKKQPYFLLLTWETGGRQYVAFYHPLVADWDVMERDAAAYRMRIRSAIREGIIDSTQVITVKSRYDRSST